MDKGLESLVSHDIFDLKLQSETLEELSLISSRLIYKVKADGTFKARLVAHGWAMKIGGDCGGTYVPCAELGARGFLWPSPPESGGQLGNTKCKSRS